MKQRPLDALLLQLVQVGSCLRSFLASQHKALTILAGRCMQANRCRVGLLQASVCALQLLHILVHPASKTKTRRTRDEWAACLGFNVKVLK